MNNVLPISVINQWTSPKATAPEKEKNPDLHEFVTYDPKASSSSSQNWAFFWKIANVVSIIACVFFQAIIDYYLFMTAPFYLPIAVLLGFGITFVSYFKCQTKIDTYTDKVILAQKLFSKMNKINDNEIPRRLQAIGLDPKDIHPYFSKRPGKIKHLLATYEIELDKIEDAQKNIEKEFDKFDYTEDSFKKVESLAAKKYTERKWKEAGYKTPFDFKYVTIEMNKVTLQPPDEKPLIFDVTPAILYHLYRECWSSIQDKRLHIETINEEIALTKVSAAYILKLLQNPYETPLRSYVTHDTPTKELSIKRLIASKFGDKEGEVMLITTPKSDNNNAVSLKYTADKILNTNITQLGQDLFGLKPKV